MSCEILNTELGLIEYKTTGKGNPILFIHGGHSSCNETLFYKGLDLEKFKIIIPSRPGYGKTPLGKNKTPKAAVDLIIKLLDHLKIEKVIVYGISAGGLTAIELASNYPNKVSKLILASAVSKKWLDMNGDIYKLAQKMFNPKTEWLIWGMVRIFSAIIPRMIAKSFYPQFSLKENVKISKNSIKDLTKALKHYRSKDGFLNDIDRNIQDDVIKKVSCPTLIIHSKNDNSVSPDHAEYAHKMIKGSRLELLNNDWGHLFWIGEDSNESIKKTVEFMEE